MKVLSVRLCLMSLVSLSGPIMVGAQDAYFKIVDYPEVGHDVTYHFRGTKGRILRCYDVDRDSAFELLYRKLEIYSNKLSHGNQ